MKDIKEYITERNGSERIDADLSSALIRYARYYDYDASQLIASVLWFLQGMCVESDKSFDLRNPNTALKTWKDEFLKAQEIVG